MEPLPPLKNLPSHERPRSVSDDFALMLEMSCSFFESLMGLSNNDIRITAADQVAESRSWHTISLALATSFVAYTCRAYRICEHGKALLKISREARNDFLKAIKPVVAVRDVNEHGFDAKQIAGKVNARPTLHTHGDSSAAVDETSLMINGPQQILMGPLNLYEIYTSVAQMRSIAGFKQTASP